MKQFLTAKTENANEKLFMAQNVYYAEILFDKAED